MDVARGRDILARWCDLAEQRLEYLTVLFETGRWRRYYSERAFLENIQDAKSGLQAWRDLSIREASPDNSAVDMSWLGYPSPRDRVLRDQAQQYQPEPVQIADEPPPQVLIVLEGEHVASDDAPSAPEMDDAPEPVLDIDSIAERYPLLHNAL
jgi:hypothetical protein